MLIKIKPHHFLDILKLYGKGLDVFVPDQNYGHDFYRIANLIVQGNVSKIIFTKYEDDICSPCKYNLNHECTDVVKNTDESKQSHNIKIDTTLMENLNIEEKEEFTFADVINLLNTKLDYNVIKEAWSHADKEEIDFRHTYITAGLKKLNISK